MPTLQFKGKTAIWNHHLSIPYHTLEEVSKFDFQKEKSNGNLIIEGDNLIALKALLPKYARRVKCIYIDPPFNTGKQNWVFNDNVNSPLIREWLGKEVGADDLTRHDKWLCMMVPRIQLAKELLAEDGVFICAIDDNEFHRLGVLLTELFTESEFESHAITIVHNPRGIQGTNFSYTHEYAYFVFRSGKELVGSRQIAPEDIDWRNLRDNGGESLRTDARNCFYPIITDGKQIIGFGDVAKDSFHPKKQNIKDGKNFHIYPVDKEGVERKWRYARQSVEEIKHLLRIKKNGDDRLEVEIGKDFGTVRTVWQDKRYDANEYGTKLISSLLEDNKKFDFPKSLYTVEDCIGPIIRDHKDAIVMDFFAGSGTTMHAVLDLNKADGGNRQCILVQMTEATDTDRKKNVCQDITRVRVKNAIKHFGFDSGFQYLRIGKPIDPESILKGELPTFEEFAKYVFYLCTGEYLPEKSKPVQKDFFVGNFGKSAIYLIYEDNFEKLAKMALNLDIAEKIKKNSPDERIMVYAPACFLDRDYLQVNQIEFISIPYGLFERQAE